MNTVHKAPVESAVDIKALQCLSETTGIPIDKLLRDLGIERPRCSSSEKVILQYNIAKSFSDEERSNALGDWSRFVLIAIEKVTTPEEAKKIYDMAPETDARQVALEKWNELSFKKAEGARTVETVKEAYDTAPPGGPAQYACFQKWDELSLKQIDGASSIDQIKTVFDAAPDGSISQQKTLGKWATICTTTSEMREAYQSSIGGPVEKEMLEKLNERAIGEIDCAHNVLEVRTVYHSLPEESGEPRRIATQKMYTLYLALQEKDKKNGNGRI